MSNFILHVVCHTCNLKLLIRPHLVEYPRNSPRLCGRFSNIRPLTQCCANGVEDCT